MLLPSYEEWQAMPEGLERAATAALAYFWPGDIGPWPENVDKEDIRKSLAKALHVKI